jgi:hypothetical protein
MIIFFFICVFISIKINFFIMFVNHWFPNKEHYRAIFHCRYIYAWCPLQKPTFLSIHLLNFLSAVGCENLNLYTCCPEHTRDRNKQVPRNCSPMYSLLKSGHSWYFDDNFQFLSFALRYIYPSFLLTHILSQEY